MFHRRQGLLLKRIKINPVIKTLIMADFMLWSANNLIAPLFAIFITESLGAGIEVAGIASAIYLISTAVFEAPIALIIDSTKSERDDLLTSVVGILIMGMAYILFIFIDTVWQLYLLQFLLGIGFALSYPGWNSLFTGHIDKNFKALEWSIDDTLLSLGMAATAALGGFLVKTWGFDLIFLLVGIFQMVGAFMLLTVESKVKSQ